MDEVCVPCKEAGFNNILAHYKGTPAGMSHNGKAIPPMCYDHKNGKVPKHFPQPVAVEAKPAYEVFTRKKPDPEIDIEKALALRQAGKTWKEVSEELGVDYNKVYVACRARDTQVKPRPKWEECLKAIAPIAMGASKTVTYPPGGNRSQMNSIIGSNKITWTWRFSLKDNGDGTVTATKIGLWSAVDGKNAAQDEEAEAEDMAAEPIQKSRNSEDVKNIAPAKGNKSAPWVDQIKTMLALKQGELADIRGQIEALETVIKMFEEGK